MQKFNLFFLAILLIFSTQSCKKDDIDEPKEIIKIGALLPLTGDLSRIAENSKAAIELAAVEINEWFENQDINKTIEITFKDNENSPSFTLALCKDLKKDSINVIIGPMASNNLAAIRDYCIENEISLISPSSTNPKLAIADDNIYRFAPDDTQQARIIAKTMYDNGIRKILSFIKLGQYETNLNNEIGLSFAELGGELVSVTPYSPKTTYNFGNEIDSLAGKLSDLLESHSEEEIAIQMIGYDEGVEILKQSSDVEVLSRVRWYGCDGFTLSDKLLNEESAAQFAVDQELCAPLFAEPGKDKYEFVKQQIEERSGLSAGVYSVNAYDACWLAAKSLKCLTEYSADSFHTQFISESADYDAATGDIELNEFGDRTNIYYDIWQVMMEGGSYLWKKIATIQ